METKDKVLMINPEKCTGCRLCELVCAVKHDGVSNPARSRIRVMKWEMDGVYIPMAASSARMPLAWAFVLPMRFPAMTSLTKSKWIMTNASAAGLVWQCVPSAPWALTPLKGKYSNAIFAMETHSV